MMVRLDGGLDGGPDGGLDGRLGDGDFVEDFDDGL